VERLIINPWRKTLPTHKRRTTPLTSPFTDCVFKWFLTRFENCLIFRPPHNSARKRLKERNPPSRNPLSAQSHLLRPHKSQPGERRPPQREMFHLMLPEIRKTSFHIVWRSCMSPNHAPQIQFRLFLFMDSTGLNEGLGLTPKELSGRNG